MRRERMRSRRRRGMNGDRRDGLCFVAKRESSGGESRGGGGGRGVVVRRGGGERGDEGGER